MEIIIDIGSGNTCRNELRIVREMIDQIVKIDNHKHDIILKAQLFNESGDNIPLYRSVFSEMYDYGKSKGYKVTASVFDIDSLKYLLHYDIPFVKIANNRALDWLIGEVPRKIHIYQSLSPKEYWQFRKEKNMVQILCVSKYPATIEDYRNGLYFAEAVSDHTVGLELARRLKAQIYECHFALDDSTGLDSGPWAKRPEELKELLNLW